MVAVDVTTTPPGTNASTADAIGPRPVETIEGTAVVSAATGSAAQVCSRAPSKRFGLPERSASASPTVPTRSPTVPETSAS